MSHASPVVASQVVRRTEFICLQGECCGFDSVVVFPRRRWLNRQKENIAFCLGHLPAENLLESALDFFGVKQFLA